MNNPIIHYRDCEALRASSSGNNFHTMPVTVKTVKVDKTANLMEKRLAILEKHALAATQEDDGEDSDEELFTGNGKPKCEQKSERKRKANQIQVSVLERLDRVSKKGRHSTDEQIEWEFNQE